MVVVLAAVVVAIEAAVMTVGGWYDNVMNVVYSKDLTLKR